MSRPARDEGAIAILAAALAVALFGFGAIVVDLGMARVTSADSQEAADAAALAGAGALYDDPASPPDFDAAADAVFSSAAENGTTRSAWDSCTAQALGPSWVKYDTTSCIAFDSPTSPRRIRVVLPPRHVDAAFGGIVGYSGGDVVAAAVAQARDRSMQDCSLCVSGHLDVDGTVQADGDGSIIAGSGQVHGGGHVELTLDAVDANAGIGFEDYPPNPAPFSDRYSPQPLQAPTQDPFAGAVTAPSLLPTNRPTDLECGDTDTVRADTAYRSVTVTGSCTVEPGTVFIVGLLRVDSDGSLTQSSSLATTLYFGCRQRRRAAPCTGGGTRQGTLEVDPGGRLDLTTGGAVTGPWPLSILYDRGNDATMSVDGSASTGSVYLPGGNDVSVGRDGQLAIDGLLSVGSLTLVDGGQVAVTATGLGSRAGAFRVALAR